ncbi:MAG: hypothetical protein LBG79_07595 [Spirochaetaceae bacterium]|jgi:hypothetical protein|nr:hypothetical protein [Spirochaetaceae bacterium]
MADKLERLLNRYDELDLRGKERVLGMAEALRFAAHNRAACPQKKSINAAERTLSSGAV